MSTAPSDPTVDHLLTLDARLQPFAVTLINAARRVGVPLMIISGRRSSALNADVGGAAYSLHLHGLAFDVQVYGFTRDQVPVWWWEALGAYWERLGGRWGGRFSVPDVNHFDSGSSVF